MGQGLSLKIRIVGNLFRSLIFRHPIGSESFEYAAGILHSLLPRFGVEFFLVAD